jgi:NADH-quinone oxidoreductase subunit M
MTQDCFLVWFVLTPLLGALACLPFSEKLAKYVALVVSLVGVFLAVVLYIRFDASRAAEWQMAVSYPWIPSFQINFAMAVDGLSFPLVLLSKLMIPIAILASWGETRKLRLFMMCFLVLDAAMAGTFLATDIFLFYIFWELMLIPMILIIGVWGSHERIYASIKFFLFTFAGSVLMLVAIFWVFNTYHEQFGVYSADIRSLYKVSFGAQALFAGLTAQELVFLAFTIAFAIKVPLFPLHTWLPDAHVQAPTGGSVLLAAVLLKMGTYGLLRFSIPMCPVAFQRFAEGLVILSVIGIWYGAWVAFQQTDMKKLVAYSSVSHLGFVVLGIATFNAEGLTGSVLQMVNHGLSTGALFLLVGMLYERRHTRNFADYGGLADVVPRYAFWLVFVACSSMAVPGLNGFVGEFMILLGAFKANRLWAIFAVAGVIFGAVYMLFMIRNILFGTSRSAENGTIKDMSARDWAAMVPLAVFIVILGIYPKALLFKIQGSLDNYWNSINPPSTTSQQEKGIKKSGAIEVRQSESS